MKRHQFLPLLICFCLAACSPLSLPTLLTATTGVAVPTAIAATVTLSPTKEPTNSPTPDVPRPMIDSNLSAQNNASMVLDNGILWVVKNSYGNVTATWDSTLGEWTYDYENIQMQVGIAELSYDPNQFSPVREGITVTVPADMLKPLSPSQQDPNPLVPSGYYGDYEQKATIGVVTMAEIGIDYRGIILIDPAGTAEGKRTEQDVIIFTIQYKDHPDVLNVLLVPINVLPDMSMRTDLFPAGSTDPGTMRPGPMWDTFITILKTKNPVGRRMSIQVYVSDTTGETSALYSPDHKRMVDAIVMGKPIPSGLDIRLGAENLSMPHDLR